MRAAGSVRPVTPRRGRRPRRGQPSAGDVAAGRRLFAIGAAPSTEQGPHAAQAVGVWTFASQLTIKDGRTDAAGVHVRIAAAAYRSGDPVVHRRGRVAATPLRRAARTDDALGLLERPRPTDGRAPAYGRRA